MKIDKNTIDNLSKLARLKFSNDESKDMVNDLQKMLKFINKLNEIDTEQVSPLNYIHNISNIYREDEVENIDVKNKIIKNAPNHNSDYIKVPKVVKK
ncbi:MAG: Asp-tRNA(Asn)/Glu-tRNA(Gln) amidotransferase GatCAB subunit C [Flavobacteriales bacterium]|nr:Asp-tRNA(Asn)/Glu-tRNA(Gln) amidotransferase GatCAB subunit C [Flavobacteriales bacterium]|tara:strand:+ start:199 stop:489 length:291 start_codon:yes stop_codon:yes gene_type:complete